MLHEKDRLITDRLILRKLRKDDAFAMFKNWDSDPEVAKYTLWVAHESVETTKQLVDMWLEEEKDGKIVRFVITEKGSDEPIGAIDTVKFINDVPEIGYCLSRKHWNKGYMSEACKTFVNYLFELGYNKIFIRADVRNTPSLKVIENCGFKFRHEEFIEHRSIFRPESVTVRCYEINKK